MNYIKLYNLKPGDRIVVPKSWLGIIQHHTIYLGQNYQGEDLVAENAPGLYVRIITASDFFRENPTVTKVIEFKGSNSERRLAVERALKKIGQPYNLINYNCEHFATEVQYGSPSSSQVSLAMLGLLLLVAFIAD